MGAANDAAWERYLTVREIVLDGRSYSVAADDLKRLTGREPRLLAKFDQPEEVPRCLREAGYGLLPVRHGEYRLCRDDLFCELPACGSAAPVVGELPFPLETAARGQGEAQYVDLAHNTGLLSCFAGVAPLYLTIRGRERTGSFSFRFGGETVWVEAVQIEVDAGYEGERDLLLIEAKMGQPRHVNVRQLYYPWRHFKSIVPRKTVRPVVLTYDIATTRYELHEFTFTTTDDPTTWYPLRSAAYRLFGPEQQRLDELLEPDRQHPRDLVPQADDLNKIVQVLEAVEAGTEDSEAVAARLAFDPRQARYYREAADYLGLLEPGSWQATAAGRQLVRAGPRQRRALLARAVVNSWVVVSALRRGGPVTAELLAAVIADVPGPGGGRRYNPTTARRRVKTLLAWLRWLADEVGCFRLEGDRYLPC